MTPATLAPASTCKGCGQVETPAVREAWFARTADCHTPTWQQSPAELPRTFALEVEWADIRDGIMCSGHFCPVARALSRWLFEQGIKVVDVSVGHRDVEIVLDWSKPSVRFFHTGTDFVSAYDACRRVEPTTISFVREPAR